MSLPLASRTIVGRQSLSSNEPGMNLMLPHSRVHTSSFQAVRAEGAELVLVDRYQRTRTAEEIARRDGLFSLLPLTLEHHAKELLRAPSVGFRIVLEDKQRTAIFLAHEGQVNKDIAQKRRDEMMARPAVDAAEVAPAIVNRPPIQSCGPVPSTACTRAWSPRAQTSCSPTRSCEPAAASRTSTVPVSA